MSIAELVAELRKRADDWLNEPRAGDYWRGYANGLRSAADSMELNLRHTCEE